MIKTDFHIHTVATASDSYFEFDMEAIKTYASKAELDALAVINHNIFDLEQYKQIVSAVQAKVYPGIEINLEGGHLLLISDGNELDDFSQRCLEVTRIVSAPDISISLNDLKNIFDDLSKYILIA